MAIAKKPKTKKSQVEEQSINALINKGGSVAEEGSVRTREDKPILLRIPGETLKQIDQAVSAKKIKTPRHTWLLEAIYEKLERDD